MRSSSLSLFVFAFAAIPVHAGAQAVATRTLAKPEVEFSEPFTALTAVRELKDGRIVAADPRDKTLQLVDLKAGTSTKLAREGQGPGEYGMPQVVIPLPGDSSGLVDPLNRRILVIQPDGKVGGFIEMPTAGGGGPIQMGMLPSAADLKGNLYAMAPPFRIVNGQPQSADSAALLRFNFRTKKVDTVAFLALPKGNSQVSGGGGQVRVMIGGANPFLPRDEWSVAPDGRVAVLRAADYHVDWFGPGGKAAGQPIVYDRIKVSEKHKQEWRDGRKNQLGIMVNEENGRRTARAVPGGGGPEPTDWPDVMPPFLAQAAIAAPNGQVWVKRTGEAGAVPTYDVIDAAGKLVQRVALPKKARVVGFGVGVVYVTRLDDDDLLYLGRYRL